MSYSYPANVIKHVQNQWARRYLSGDECPLPSKKAISTLVETMYHASLMSEEGRRPQLHVCYVPPNFLRQTNNAINLRPIPIRFACTREFTVRELLKLSPAVDSSKTAVLTATAADMGNGGEDDLVIWGLFELRSDWERRTAGENTHPYVPPHVLSLTSSMPGQVSIGSAGQAFVTLSEGIIRLAGVETFRIFDLFHLFAEATRRAELIVAGCFGKTSLPHSHPEMHHVEWPYLRVLRRLHHLAKLHGHGACFLFLPPKQIEKAKQAGHITIKYQTVGHSLWGAIISQAVQNIKALAEGHFGELHEFYDIEPVLPDSINGNDLLQRAETGESIDVIVNDYIAALSRFSQVDGAVLFSDELECKGFGVEILLTIESESTVCRARDSRGQSLPEVNTQSFGTRHRSAFRLCSAYEGAIAIIISQDGQSKLCAKTDRGVIYWDISGPGMFFEWAPSQ